MKTEKIFFSYSNYTLVTFLFIAAKLILHLCTNSNYELHRDELLYFNMGDHLSFGYATVPPVTGFLALIIKTIFGYSVFGIRLLPAILGSLSLVVISKIVWELGGGLPALIIASVSYLLSPGFLLLDTLFTPNATEQFLWLLVTYLIFRMAVTGKPYYWILTGILLGISFLNKYSVLFFMAGFFIALLFSEYRKLLWSGYLYLAIVTGIAIITPNIIWQYSHNWPVVIHMSELSRTQLANMNPLTFFTDLFSLNLASTTVWLFGLTSLLFMKEERRYRFIGIASLLIILMFLFLKGKGYYVLGVIPFLFATGGYAMEKYLNCKLVSLRNSILFIIVIVSLAALPSGLPLLSLEKYSGYRKHTKFLKMYPFYRWEDGKIHDISQVYSDMTGWSELAGYTAKAYNMLSEDEKKNCTIYGQGNYGYAGAIHFYGKRYGLPDAVTFHESYTFWAPDSIPDGPLIFINSSPDDLNELFGEIIEAGYIKNKYFRENGLKVFLCKSPKKDISNVYRNLALKEKSLYIPNE